MVSFLVRLDRNPSYIAGVLALLIVPQLNAMRQQFHAGYRPFEHAPQRVTFSWDMFSTAISRCDVRWDPPIVVHGRTLASLHETGSALEWDPVYDRVEDYRMAARVGCASAAPASNGGSGTVAHLQCFTFEGKTVQDDIPCR